MSGGSYNYLYNREPELDEETLSLLDQMAQDMAKEGFPEIAAEITKYYGNLKKKFEEQIFDECEDEITGPDAHLK